MLLIIEDNLDLVELYKMALSLVKISAETAVTGPAALRRIQCQDTPPPKVVILDLHLCGENGVEINGGELFDKMRQVWPQTKIIVSSADIAWCQKFNGVADMVLEKPIVNMSYFLDQVQSMMA
jgi:CheY-like chemotaxis protein